jgi:hypothetical protein
MNERKKQRQDIRKTMEYAVADGNLSAATDLLVQYRDDKIALDLLQEFYAYLPEAQEDHIKIALDDIAEVDHDVENETPGDHRME